MTIKMEIIKKLPQISVPFGEFKLLPNSEVLLYQKVGVVQTQKPLLVINTGVKKSAIFTGEGLWSWRLEEFQIYYGNATFDDGGTMDAATFLLRMYVEKSNTK